MAFYPTVRFRVTENLKAPSNNLVHVTSAVNEQSEETKYPQSGTEYPLPRTCRGSTHLRRSPGGIARSLPRRPRRRAGDRVAGRPTFPAAVASPAMDRQRHSCGPRRVGVKTTRAFGH